MLHISQIQKCHVEIIRSKQFCLSRYFEDRRQLYTKETNREKFQGATNENIRLKGNHVIEEAADYLTKLTQNAFWTATSTR